MGGKNTMEASKVYYTDFRCPVGTSLLEKLRRVCIAAGIKDIDMDGRFVAIKMHFGELGNLAFLRPNYAKVVADLCKEQGGMPFLTDCNTLYPGSRKNALEHLSCAYEAAEKIHFDKLHKRSDIGLRALKALAEKQ
jgi:uncharacterized Fe-S center protein